MLDPEFLHFALVDYINCKFASINSIRQEYISGVHNHDINVLKKLKKKIDRDIASGNDKCIYEDLQEELEDYLKKNDKK